MSRYMLLTGKNSKTMCEKTNSICFENSSIIGLDISEILPKDIIETRKEYNVFKYQLNEEILLNLITYVTQDSKSRMISITFSDNDIIDSDELEELNEINDRLFMESNKAIKLKVAKSYLKQLKYLLAEYEVEIDWFDVIYCNARMKILLDGILVINEMEFKRIIKNRLFSEMLEGKRVIING